MGMKPEYYPRGHGTGNPRRGTPLVDARPTPVTERPVAKFVPPVPSAPSAPPHSPGVTAARMTVTTDARAARLGVVWSEILAAPRAHRPWRPKHKQKQ